jgi:UbiD family decarboxylase
MVDASLARFLDRVGYERVEGVLSREFEVSRLLAERQGCGPALVFRVEGSEIDAAGNVVDTRGKLYGALGAAGDEEAYRRLLEAMASPRPLKRVGAPKLRRLERGLLGLPAVRFYEGEAGHYLSASIYIACYEGVCNASIHRTLILGEKRAVARIVPRHLWALYRRARERGEDLPVTIVLGVHPAVLLAAASSPRFGVFELEVASSILGGLEAYESPVHGNPVPLGAAAVVEGWLTSEEAEEGPYVDALLTYDRVRRQPVVRVEAVYVDPDGVGHVILGGGLEHALLMGFPREAAIWDAVSRVVPRVYKVRLTPASGGWLHAVISIEKQHEGDGKSAIMAAFAAHPSLKHVVVVDGDVDPDDPFQVEWAIATRFQADRDLIVVKNARGSTLDPSSSDGLTAKMGLDATKPLRDGPGFRRGSIPGLKAWGSACR